MDDKLWAPETRDWRLRWDNDIAMKWINPQIKGAKAEGEKTKNNKKPKKKRKKTEKYEMSWQEKAKDKIQNTIRKSPYSVPVH